ncbi:LIM domain protein [Trichuris suis]|nr:LIM domain protein [Trichuris suis]
MDMSAEQLCFSCSRKIYGNKAVLVFGQIYHLEHFTCHRCHSRLSLNVSCHKNDKEILCSNCVCQLLATCPGCTQPLKGKAVVALNRYWHRECFRCDRCDKVFSNEKYALVDRIPYCKKCVSTFKKRKKKKN